MFSQIIEIFSRPMLQPSFLFHGTFGLSGRGRTSRHHPWLASIVDCVQQWVEVRRTEKPRISDIPTADGSMHLRISEK
jgi:hypothetical protein